MMRAADFATTDEAENDDHESLAEKSIMTANKYKEEAKLEIEKSCLETMIAKREMTISQFEIHYKAIRSMLPLRPFTELPSVDDATPCPSE